jgi:hypothetical protein
MKRLLSLALGVFALSTASSAIAQQVTQVSVVSVVGSGCPSKSDYSVSLDPNGTSFLVQYGDRFKVSAGQGSTALDHHGKNCTIIVRVDVPDGYTYGLKRVQMSGDTHLETNANASAKFLYYLQGLPQTAPIPDDIRESTISNPGTPVAGVIDDDWATDDSIPLWSTLWNPCDSKRDIVLMTQLMITSPDADPPSVVQAYTAAAEVALKTCP